MISILDPKGNTSGNGDGDIAKGLKLGLWQNKVTRTGIW
jgi:hypothetical protein